MTNHTVVIRAKSGRPAYNSRLAIASRPEVRAMMSMPIGPDRSLNAKEVSILFGRSIASIYRDMEVGAFPRPIRIGSRSIRWMRSTIEAWLASRPT